ncbi:Uncharacterised protein [uncultured archaeon]|nr:Uncharacterised protein [uncultured archaeon]
MVMSPSIRQPPMPSQMKPSFHILTINKKDYVAKLGDNAIMGVVVRLLEPDTAALRPNECIAEAPKVKYAYTSSFAASELRSIADCPPFAYAGPVAGVIMNGYLLPVKTLKELDIKPHYSKGRFSMVDSSSLRVIVRRKSHGFTADEVARASATEGHSLKQTTVKIGSNVKHALYYEQSVVF